MSEPEYNPKMLSAKMKLLERFRARAPQPETDAEHRRLPPGQHQVSGFPVLDLGVRPPVNQDTWRLQVTGEVERPWFFSWEEFRSLPRIEVVRDFHCVTSWSRFDLRWGGVAFRTVAERVGLRPDARFVIAAGGEGYTINLAVEACLRNDVILADELEGQPLTLEHGGPVRLLGPRWFWETGGCHRNWCGGECLL